MTCILIPEQYHSIVFRKYGEYDRLAPIVRDGLCYVLYGALDNPILAEIHHLLAQFDVVTIIEEITTEPEIGGEE